MKYLIIVITGLLLTVAAYAQNKRVDAIIESLKKPTDKNVLVVAHRRANALKL